MRRSDNQLQSKIRKTPTSTKGRFNLNKLLYPPHYDRLITTFPAIDGQSPPPSKKRGIHQLFSRIFSLSAFSPKDVQFKWSI